jgi:hypothetical protein
VFTLILGPCKVIRYEVQKILVKYLDNNGAWGSVVVKALRS